ncbi:hypothetical protein Thal_1060 [Thermocrinis albus DSM 14484]|uniref:Uncharacterized protein n=1 Tax=Thermocrinis albus (strain DSM 14484 / JCM 11386 / HI 11/12) TaxID=638303 RepID=D3SLR2_THEAH|nr:hypothetical protein [Thermocrinis albus]ADC89692.1 hypothetical protein Thal_1060 [Thermocrinis albus DSM 14484]
MKNPVDVHLIEELSHLEYFIVKTPINASDFWKEWQEKFSRAYMSRIAVKKLLKNKRLAYEEAARYRSLLQTYEDVLMYLENLKNLALGLRGVFPTGHNVELDDEDIDLDF